MKYLFDLDQTLCSNVNGDYKFSKPLQNRIDKVNELYEKGNHITIYSSRGMNRFDENVKKCYEEFYNLTRDQLVEWGVKFDRLLLGKTAYDIFICDKAINDKVFF